MPKTCCHWSTPPRLLDFVRVSGADLELTPVGKDFTTADIQTSKQIFAQQARTRAPLVRTICNALADCPDGTLRAGFFLDILQQGFSAHDARQQFHIAISWGRYAELFDYNTHTDQITAEANPGNPYARIYRRRPVTCTAHAIPCAAMTSATDIVISGIDGTSCRSPLFALTGYDHGYPGRVGHSRADGSQQHSGESAAAVAAHHDELG